MITQLRKHVSLKSEKKILFKIEGGTVLSLCWRHMLNFNPGLKH